jgi:cytochrome c-type biogenesis protein CcmE
MTRKRRRLYLVLGGVGTLAVVSALVLFALSDNINVFYSPTELHADGVRDGVRVRIGGLVETGSLVRESDGRTIEFRVTDGRTAVDVAYSGIIPDLFREGQGVMVEGKLARDGTFQAESVLAKHDENYMPREVADALKKSGHWQETGASVPVAVGAKR